MLTITLTRNAPNGKAVTGKMIIPLDAVPLRENDAPITVETLENADYLIPAGTYPLELTWSPRFKKLLPILRNVPDREGIRIHMGTKPEHSEGCILTTAFGMGCLDALFNRIEKYFDSESVQIEIIDAA